MEEREEWDCDGSFGCWSDNEGGKIDSISFSSIQTLQEESGPMRAKESGEEKEIKNMTLHEKMMALMALQTASGHFAEHKMIGDIVGKPLEDLKARVPDSKPESMKSWLTAIVIAFLELSCLEEKDLWQMSVEKARAVVLESGLIENAKNMIAKF